MEKIIEFVTDFIQNEYLCNLAKYDIQVTDAEYEIYRNKMQTFFFPGMPDMYARGMTVQQLNEDEEWKNIYRQNLKSVIPRSLFQIRHYHSPNLGANYRARLKGKDLFGALIGDVENLARPTYVSREAFVSLDDEMPRIIYHKSFSSKSGTWRHSHDHAPTRVEDPGAIVEIRNLMPPEDENSLREYLRVGGN
jgi:hypothetical protein